MYTQQTDDDKMSAGHASLQLGSDNWKRDMYLLCYERLCDHGLTCCRDVILLS